MKPSDAERERVADELRQAVVDGLLPFDQLESRLDAVYAAETLDELAQLVRWLPNARRDNRLRSQLTALAVAVVLVAIAALAAMAATSDDDSQRGASRVTRRTSPTSTRAEPQASTSPTAASATAGGGRPHAVDGEYAVIAVDKTRREVTLETDIRTAIYKACSGFDDFDALTPGDFGIPTLEGSPPCFDGFAITGPPVCEGAGYGGYAEVSWNGYNEAAHSVLYGTDNGFSLAVRWCHTPTVVDADNRAVGLKEIPRGAKVRLIHSRDDWLKTIEVIGPGR